jgi:hypothetical protein
MPNNLEQLIVDDVPLGELARNALNESVEAIPLYTKGFDTYTRLVQVLQKLDEDIALTIRQAGLLS